MVVMTSPIPLPPGSVNELDKLLLKKKIDPWANKAVKQILVGNASWYGPGFHGRITANGERYNMYDMTAAHKTLRFNTMLRVINLSTSNSIIVRVNDRGPYIDGRILDLSKAAAQKLGVIEPGVIKVRIEVLEP